MAGSVRRELVPGALWVDLYDHTLDIGGVDRRCLTAVTDGLAGVGQPEMVFTVTAGTSGESFPPGVLEYLRWLRGGGDGQVLGPGHMSGGLAGSGSFTGAVFSAAGPEHRVPLPRGSVQGVLLTEGELEMAARSSSWRVLARLGQEARVFPWPFWSDPLRPGTYLPGDADHSVFGRVRSPELHLGRLNASLDGTGLDVMLTVGEAGQVAERLTEFPGLTIVPPPDPASDATLVWSPGQTKATAICRGQARVPFATAQFLMIVANHGRRDEIRFRDDGFAVIVSKKTTMALIQKLRQGQAIALTAANKSSVRFSVTEETDGSIGYTPARHGHLSGEYFQHRAVRLYQPEAELEERIPDGIEGVAAYIKALELAGEQYFSRLGRDFGSMGIVVAVGIKPPARTRLWCDQVGGEIPADVWRAFTETLDSAGEDARPSVAGPVTFALEWSLGAGPATGFPMGPSAWVKAASSAAGPLSVPDELFDIVFPD